MLRDRIGSLGANATEVTSCCNKTAVTRQGVLNFIFFTQLKSEYRYWLMLMTGLYRYSPSDCLGSPKWMDGFAIEDGSYFVFSLEELA